MKHILSTGALASTLFVVSCGVKSDQASDNQVDSQYSTIETEYMDKNVRPQDDFFLYANGKWVANNPVPSNESRWGSFNELDQSNKEKLTAILEEAQRLGGEKGSQNQLLGDYYASYKDTRKRNELGLSPIQEELDAINNLTDKSGIPSVLAMLHKRGIGAAFGFGVGQDLKNVKKNTVSLFQGGISLPNKNYYVDENKLYEFNSFKEHIVNVLMSTPMANNTDVDDAMARIVEFESMLAESMMEPAQLRIPENTYNKMSLNQVADIMGEFPFSEYLAEIGIESFDTMIVGQPDYVRRFSELYSDQELDNWKYYLTWKVYDHYAGHLDENFEKMNFNFYSVVLRGKKEMKPINERAIDEITGLNIGEMLGKAFVEKHFSVEAKNRVNAMVDNLLAVYQERINELEWMTADTKKEALVKLNSIGRKLGYPDKWKDYSSLDFAPDTYISNFRNIMLFAHKENMEKLNKPVDLDKWGMPAHMVNAYYHPLLNEIAFPAGIMQAPFFDVTAEDAVNYGSIGMVIGHEFTHGFDDMGSKFAADGSFTNWWTEADRKAFEERTQKFGETYAAFCPLEGHCVNPQLTMGENIADLGGLTMAYYAYTRTEEFKSGGKREGFTPAQRFFLAYAQLWKINYTDAEMKNRIANDPHSPGMYRVNGPLMNCPEFFEAFNVKPTDPMRNDEKKMVTIW